ncbi:hypothetical protein [Rhizobium sp. NXC24]|uniref:hypothetical protein n=1 Tax=Rhizobium sp. NXC24 TaxID=2048897 RepID=UPI000CDF3A44|nr:hypothetical protein [Rhizobium sp. NXC24]AVA21358.1 hypothetical protein NXC24_CH01707 [Rhizobium sp. NXC24]
MSSGTGLIENLKIVYESYGRFKSFYRSGYTWVALVFTALSWRTAVDGTWVQLAFPILPTLAGFSIAAYAVYFSVLSEKERAALQKPDPKLNNRSPLLILASAVSHAVFVQVAGILLAIVFNAKPFPTPTGYADWARYTNVVISLIGLFLTIYGILLILASVLSIFRILYIKTNVSNQDH